MESRMERKVFIFKELFFQQALQKSMRNQYDGQFDYIIKVYFLPSKTEKKKSKSYFCFVNFGVFVLYTLTVQPDYFYLSAIL